MASFFEGATLSELTVDAPGKFRESREVAPGTARKELEYLRTFLNFCLDRDWIEKNMARRLKPPKADSAGALPFERTSI